MSPIPPVAASITAYDPSLMQAGTNLNAGPEAMGRGLLSSLDHFNTHEAHFRDTITQAAGGSPADNASSAGAMPDDPVQAQTGAAAPTPMQQGAALQQKSMGLMMQTYSFALEATMVTNAATTFTSSINTLIKTQ